MCRIGVDIQEDPGGAGRHLRRRRPAERRSTPPLFTQQPDQTRRRGVYTGSDHPVVQRTVHPTK